MEERTEKEILVLIDMREIKEPRIEELTRCQRNSNLKFQTLS
jgi:ERCC4-type nuclease